MRNIHIIATDKPSRLFKYNNGLGFSKGFQNGSNAFLNQNIYITNSEEIKEGDWCFDINGKIFKHKNYFPISIGQRKIILTTDQDLIADGVQTIPDDFLEFIVKNPSCESVEVKSFKSYSKNNYIIFIPKGDIIMELDKDPKLVEFDKEIESNIKKQEIIDENKKLKTMLKWWQSQPILRQQSLCRLYLPTSNYLSLKRNEILFIYESSEEPKQSTKDRIMSETSKEIKQKAKNYGNSLVMKQTAVEWLHEEITKKSVNDPSHNVLDIFEQAKEMEKQQQENIYERERFRAVDFAKWFSDFNDLTWNEQLVSKERLNNLYEQYLKTLGGTI